MNKRISDIRESSSPVSDAIKLERRRARERMRYVDPETAGKVLAHHRYWTVQFLQLYLDRCDETAFDLPADAYLLATHAPEMARRIRMGPGAGEYDSAVDKVSSIVLALAVKGSCCRAKDETEEAALCFRRAFDGIGSRNASPRAMAELHRRYAALLAMANSNEEAAVHIDQCLSFCRDHDLRECGADALALRGYVSGEAEPANAILDFIEASRRADIRSDRGRRTAHAALNNVIYISVHSAVALRAQETALRLLERLKSQLKGTPSNVRKFKVLWIEGLLLSNLRIDRHAERQLTKARRGMLRLQQPIDFVLASLDLISLHLNTGEEEGARELASETSSTVGQMNTSPALRKMISRWAASQLTKEDTLRMRRAVLEFS